jgi:predicted nucleotidyltransferase
MKTKTIKEKIKEYFFIYPKSKLRVREIERKLSLPLPSVIKYCKELEEEKILRLEKIGSVALYTASRSEIYLLEKKLYNIKSLYESGLIDYIKKELSNPGIVLFGSYSKGEDIEDSDIDIYIETLSEDNIKIERFEKKLFRKIQIFKYKNLKDISNSFLANNIINGITLNNYIEVFK